MNYITGFIKGLGRLPEKLSLAFCRIEKTALQWREKKKKKKLSQNKTPSCMLNVL